MRRSIVNRLKTTLSRCCSTVEKTEHQLSLVGRNYLEPIDFTESEIKSLFWTASEFKALSDNEYNIRDLENKTGTLLLSEPNIHFQSSLQLASKDLKIPMNVIIDSTWEQWQFPEDAGRILGKTCDVLFIKSKFYLKAKALATGAKIPVIIISDTRYANLRALSDIFTLREKFGYLENLHVCWIGSPTSLINTYLLSMPRFGIKIKFFCCHFLGEKVSPIAMSKVRTLGKEFVENCQEASSVEEALSHSKILAMGSNLGGQKQINQENCKEADHDFFILHSMPRTRVEICPTLFESERNLTWASYRNCQWILTAFLVRCLSDHKHITKEPNFSEIKAK
ncbi:ornithine carbamoyltransferase, mitochondrial-like [Coccinella septempunctata]|uniref:ornithine carbamoyltransferase, mitochondrial-like n=1 Tax=Coccinella septempunctata TaxID=41139 RepID=UPI001D06A6C8|nr:ornithine carbamoyltransferase, mitochondrial-like [Coccinella septempunctata]